MAHTVNDVLQRAFAVLAEHTPAAVLARTSRNILCEAITCGSVHMVRVLVLKHNADVNQADTTTGATPLITIIRSHHAPAVRARIIALILRSSRLDFEARDASGMTGVCLALQRTLPKQALFASPCWRCAAVPDNEVHRRLFCRSSAGGRRPQRCKRCAHAARRRE